jgi:hypothetical protein
MDRSCKQSLKLLLEQHPHVSTWPTSAVLSFFEAIGLNQYAPAMEKMCVSGRQLSQVTIDSLAAVYCISSFGHRNTIVHALQYCLKNSPPVQPTMHSGSLVSQFAVEEELNSHTAMRRKQAWKKYESFRDRAAMPPIKSYAKTVMNKSELDKLLTSPDKRREAWLEYMTEPAPAAPPPRRKSPPRECLSDKERAAIERKYSQVMQQHGITPIILRHNFTPLEMGGPVVPLPPSPRSRMASVLLTADEQLATGDVQVPYSTLIL